MLLVVIDELYLVGAVYNSNLPSNGIKSVPTLFPECRVFSGYGELGLDGGRFVRLLKAYTGLTLFHHPVHHTSGLVSVGGGEVELR